MYITYIHTEGYALCITLLSLLFCFRFTKNQIVGITNLGDDAQVFLIAPFTDLIFEEIESNSARIIKLKSEPISVLNISVPRGMTMNVANPYLLSTHQKDAFTALNFASTAFSIEGLNTINHFNERIFEDFSSRAFVLKRLLGNA